MARPAPASTRAVSILSFLTAHPSRGFTISELAQHLGMNLASAHATLAVLCEWGMVLRDRAHRTYVLGPALTVTGSAAATQHPAIEAAIEQADILAAELDREVGVTAIAGKDVILLALRGAQPPTPTLGFPGDRVPLLAPIGPVFVAWSDEPEINEWLARGEVDAQTASLYREVLADVRARGFSVPLPSMAAPAVLDAFRRVRSRPTDEDAQHGLAEVFSHTGQALIPLSSVSSTDELAYTTIAAPVFDPAGQVLLSLGISGSHEPVPVERIIHLGNRLVRAATIATRHARGRPPLRGQSAN